ncbi:MAG: hypothetical protein LBB08_02785, partial [Rickettsiales bacterium]|nr:hypothetical protein [Rickettsiales bacterium]
KSHNVKKKHEKTDNFHGALLCHNRLKKSRGQLHIPYHSSEPLWASGITLTLSSTKVNASVQITNQRSNKHERI